jgi:hypothetical protein
VKNQSCNHLYGNKCQRCRGAEDCFVCFGSGTVDYYDSPIQCVECNGTGKVKVVSSEKDRS